MENKWWEYYAVRYFVGTVVGSVLVASLNSEPGSPFEGRIAILGTSTESAFLGVGLVAALGFAFCYIASAPVLTLHTLRAHLRMSAIGKSKRAFALALAAPLAIATACLWRVLPPFAAAASGLIIGLQVGLLVLAASKKFSVVEQFYRGLAKARAGAMPEKDKPLTAGLEYVTSYRHLREHGNAFFIVLLEGVLAYVLLRSPSRDCAVIIMALWLLPAASAWLVGTVLESRFASKSLP